MAPGGRGAFVLTAALVGVVACSYDTQVPPSVDASASAPDAAAPAPPRVLLYTKETEWFHASNPVATQVMTERGVARGWKVTATNDSSVFNAASLSGFDVVVFLLSSGRTLEQDQRDAFASYIATGHGWVGAHSASHTDYDWLFMRELVGASFCCHVSILPGNVLVEDASDPLVAHLPATWSRTDEWYTFDRRPEDNPRLDVLLALDEASVDPNYPGPDLPPVLRVGYHPNTWKQDFGATRSFYTAMGHTVESWHEELFVTMMLKAVEWAARYGQ